MDAQPSLPGGAPSLPGAPAQPALLAWSGARSAPPRTAQGCQGPMPWWILEVMWGLPVSMRACRSLLGRHFPLCPTWSAGSPWGHSAGQRPYRARGDLHHGVEPALGGVQVPGDQLLANLGLELVGVAGQLQHMPEGERRLARLLLGGARVLELLGVCVDKGQYCLIHKGPEACGQVGQHEAGGRALSGTRVSVRMPCTREQGSEHTCALVSQVRLTGSAAPGSSWGGGDADPHPSGHPRLGTL